MYDNDDQPHTFVYVLREEKGKQKGRKLQHKWLYISCKSYETYKKMKKEPEIN